MRGIVSVVEDHHSVLSPALSFLATPLVANPRPVNLLSMRVSANLTTQADSMQDYGLFNYLADLNRLYGVRTGTKTTKCKNH